MEEPGTPQTGIAGSFLFRRAARAPETGGRRRPSGAERLASRDLFPDGGDCRQQLGYALAEEVGEALGSEARSQGVDILLGPGLNIKRSPLCGRNFEYFSEDPYLSGKLAAAYVRGIQRGGALACVKHYAVNSQEFRRMILNAEVDERALREIYLTGFEIAVKEGKPGALMTSYNQVNGLQSNENPQLMLEILRKEWGYDGMVVTDWGGSDDHIRGIQCRTTIEMPGPGGSMRRGK